MIQQEHKQSKIFFLDRSRAFDTIDHNLLIRKLDNYGIRGAILFIIYVNNMPLVCRHLEAIIFADDTNLSAIGIQCADIKEDTKKITTG